MRRKDSKTPLHLACKHSLVLVFKLLACSGVDLHAIDDHDKTPSEYSTNEFITKSLHSLSLSKATSPHTYTA